METYGGMGGKLPTPREQYVKEPRESNLADRGGKECGKYIYK